MTATRSKCRKVLVLGTEGATGDGPLQVHWHGTFESPMGLLSWDTATAKILDMTLAQADDFLLFDETVACILDAGLASPARINASGMSAGGIMTSHLVERRRYLASAVSWSGGLPLEHQPALPLGPTAVMFPQQPEIVIAEPQPAAVEAHEASVEAVDLGGAHDLLATTAVERPKHLDDQCLLHRGEVGLDRGSRDAAGRSELRGLEDASALTKRELEQLLEARAALEPEQLL